MAKVSFVATVKNDSEGLKILLDSLKKQTKKPSEIIVIDGEKTRTNRSQGRNLAIEKAKREIIAISDAGCELDKKWLEEITKPFENSKVDVVAGYYQAKTKNVFEKCVAPFALVMSDRVSPENFLPSSRSMAIRKKVWQKFGGFPEEFSDNEDYVFAHRLQKGGAKIVFCEKAIVYWQPRSNLKDFFIMIYRFSRGDAQAGLRYKKVATVFLRYILGALLFYWSWLYGYMAIWLYGFWSIWKNYRYVNQLAAIFYLPLLQITADLAVMLGTSEGLIKKI